MSQDPVVTLLDGAIDYLNEVGWCQGKLRDQAGRVCAVGAIYKQPRPDGVLAKDLYMAEDTLRQSLGIGDIPLWNDAPHRTVEDVILGFKLAKEHLLSESTA